MRKTYIAPGMVIVKVQTAGMLAGSMNLNSTTVGGGDALSRGGRGGWDDDEDGE